MTKKNYITATICLAVSIAIMISSSINFLAAQELPMPVETESLTEVRMLSDWNPNLLGTNGDTPVYIFKGEEEGGSMLVLGGTHANEVSSSLSAFTFIENVDVQSGTAYVIPYANRSAMTHNDPGEANLQYYTLETQSGERTFRFGSRATNPIDQWPDPDVYSHYPSGQQLSGSETRNLNRAYPGVEDGNLTEMVAYAICEMIRQEDIGISFDLHEASPEYPVINATVANENAMTIAANGCMELLMNGISMALETSPTSLRGLSHREWGDYTDTVAILMETANPAQGRLRGASTIDQLLGGIDSAYVTSAELGMLYVPYDEDGVSIEERCGRHLESIATYVEAYNAENPDNTIAYSGVPGYEELYLNADPADLGGTHMGTFLK